MYCPLYLSKLFSAARLLKREYLISVLILFYTYKILGLQALIKVKPFRAYVNLRAVSKYGWYKLKNKLPVISGNICFLFFCWQLKIYCSLIT